MITYTKTIPSDKLCLAYNNNILEFGTDSTLDIINAQVSINGIIVVLYPHPDKSFYLNLKQYITTFFQSTDNLDVDLSVIAFYDWTNKVFLNTDINITINFVDLSTETSTFNTSWLSGYLQINSRAIIPNNELIVLTPQKVGSKEAFLKYWTGYPFDISAYNPVVNYIYISNPAYLDNGFPDTFLVTRLFFSDGFNVSLFLPDTEFYSLYIINESTTEIYFTLNIQQLTPTCDNGFYIKWINSLGGYSYWLFENWEQNSQYKDLGEIKNNYSNLEDTLSKSIQIGKTSVNKVTATTDTINENDLSILNDLFDSPKIYQFIGTRNEINNFNDWTEISLNTTTIPKNKTKFNLSNLQLTFELPTNDTRTI